MRKLAWLIGALAALGCAGYVFVYLYRWEWNRALMMAMFFVATEVALGIALVLRSLRRLERRDEPATPQDDRVLAALQASAPQHDHFAWLGVRGDRTSVFITMFVGGGVLISALAWLVDRLAQRTAGRRVERSLAGRLQGIRFPPSGLVPAPTEALAEPAPFEDDPDLRLLLGLPR